MKLDIDIVMQSHLSDALIELEYELFTNVVKKIKFVKALILKKRSGIKEMTEDELNKLFKEVNG